MAYDRDLATRIGLRLAEQDRPVRQQDMFGGTAFMVDGNMAVGLGEEGMLVRVGKHGMDAALALPHAEPMRMGERTMGGFVVVAAAGVQDDDDLHAWIDRGLAVATSLPPK